MANVVETQYRENYGAHDWDGTGECPQHWKNKGGSTVIFLNATDDEIEAIMSHSSEYSEEYIISNRVFPEITDVFEEWEERTYWTKAEDGSWLRERYSPKSEYSMRRGLKAYRYRWEYANLLDASINHDACEFSVRYEFENGEVANSEEEATEIFKRINK